MRIRFGWSAVFGALLFLATLKMAAQEKPDYLRGFSCPLPATSSAMPLTVALGMAGKQALACPPASAFVYRKSPVCAFHPH